MFEKMFGRAPKPVESEERTSKADKAMSIGVAAASIAAVGAIAAADAEARQDMEKIDANDKVIHQIDEENPTYGMTAADSPEPIRIPAPQTSDTSE